MPGVRSKPGRKETVAKPKFQAPKGMRDLLPEDMERFRAVERAFRETCRLFGYREIRTPHLEATELFKRTVGETTDIVEKEMYTLTTKGGDELALRPENTAGVVRAYLEHGMHRSAPLQRFFYWGEMFRHESKQKKRYREFTQAGVECIGSPGAAADAEVIALAVEFFKALGLGHVRLELSTFGCPNCRPRFREALEEHFRINHKGLCKDCLRRLGANVFRILDCKNGSCRELVDDAPTIDGFLDTKCRAHFEDVKSVLNDMVIACEVNPHLVRGLDYYTRTVFEIFPADESGRQDALGAGGRYDGLAELLGGPSVPAVGFALGVDRIVRERKGEGRGAAAELGIDVYVAGPLQLIGLSQKKYRYNVEHLVIALRRAGLSCVSDLCTKRLGAQLKDADKLRASVAVILGEDEVAEDAVRLKNLQTGEQRDVNENQMVSEVKKMLETQRKESGE